MKTQYVVKTHQLCKQYGKQYAVDHIDMHIKKGDIYGFIGRNGAGKSTTLKMIAGLIQPSLGEIELFGDALTNQISHQRIGILIEEAGLYPHLNAYDNLELQATSLGVVDKQVIENVLKLMNLDHVEKKKVKDFSMGMKQRLGIAMAMLGNPDFLILDEPTNGLDPEGIREIRETLLKLNQEQGMTIIVSSHILGELNKLATTFGIIKDGVLIQEISKEELDQKCKEYLSIEVKDIEKACFVLEEMNENIEYEVASQNCIHIYQYTDSSHLISHFVHNEIDIISCSFYSQDLEDYFLKLMEGGQTHV
ncbi:MAG: ABC transporter ATP-binding protein [Coprobacillus sp.]